MDVDCQAFHDPKNTIVSPGVTALVKSRRECNQDVPETGWPPAELAGGVNRLNTPATEVERRGAVLVAACKTNRSSASLHAAWSGIGGGLQGKSKLRITPVVDELLPRKIQVHQTGPFEPATLELQSFQTAQLFLNINSAKVRRHLVAESTIGWLAGRSIA